MSFLTAERCRASGPAESVYTRAMGSSGHSRRDFLRGRAALSAAAEAIDNVLDAHLGEPSQADESGDASAEASKRVLTLKRRAMACDFELRLCASPERNDTAAGLAALDVVERVEDQLTVYRDESELVELNRWAADEAFRVDPRLFTMLQLCDRIHAQTAGAFDPTSGPLSRVWGFSRREGRMPDEVERAEALSRVGWEGVALNLKEETVRFDREGLELNANSIGKGWALDRAAESLATDGVADSLMHGGRSTLLGRGNNHQLADGGWRAGLRDPLRPDRRLAEFTLRDEALSTSGSGTQFFEHEGRRYGHLIDPRTGWPAEGLFSASVLAPTAAEADAYSTAAYILGIGGTAELCQRTGLRALLLAPGDGEGVVVHAFNLDDDYWQAQPV